MLKPQGGMALVEEQKVTVRAVERALDILMCFIDATDLGLVEISNKVSLHKSTVHRLLASLESKGFVTRDPSTDKYRLGYRVWELSANLTQSDDPAIIWLPEMERLRDEIGETVSLYVRDGNERIRIQAVQSNEPIRRVAPIGARLPLFVGASSKVLLAHADEAVKQSIIQGPDWPHYLRNEAYLQQLEEVRRQGYATSIEEREPGAAAVAAPIINRAGQLVAALSVSGPSSRLTAEIMKAQAPLITEAAKRMGKMVK